MNDLPLPPNKPITPNDGEYYERDPKSVMHRTDEQFRVFYTHMVALKQGIAALDATLPSEQHALVQHLRDELNAMHADMKMIFAFVEELTTYNIRLTEHDKSTRKAYNDGYEARYHDILSKLHPQDHRMLRWIVEYLARDEAARELPF